MEELMENSADYGIYIVDRRMKGIEESVEQLCEYMFSFASKSRRQRINQRNRTERLSDLLDWKRMGLEYVKARQLALRRAYPSEFVNGPSEQDVEAEFGAQMHAKIPRPLSAPASPRRTGTMTPGDLGSLQEGQQALNTDDYIGFRLASAQDDEEDDAGVGRKMFTLSLEGAFRKARLGSEVSNVSDLAALKNGE
jgi:glycogen(starch) synthase